MKNIKLSFHIFIYLLVLLTSDALLRAQTVPALVNYQGRLANPDGSALATADYQLTFKVYDAATNGTLVWGPQIFDGVAAQGHGAKIPVVQGYFNLMLGPVDTNGVSLANAFAGSNRFVEITVTNHAPVAPRQQILTAPFSFFAANANNANTAINFSGSLNGDVTGTQGATVVSSVGGQTSASLSNATLAANAATSANTPNTIVKRDASGNFVAGTITASSFNGTFAGNGAGITNLQSGNFSLTATGTNAAIGGIGISDSCGVFSSPTPKVQTMISNFVVTITTRGNPVEVYFATDGNASFLDSYFAVVNAASGSVIYVQLYRDGIQVGSCTANSSGSSTVLYGPGLFRFVDLTAAAGNHSYQVKFYNGGDTQSSLEAHAMRMIAHEL